MPGGAHDALERALAVSQSMLDAARQSRWQEVAELDAQRQPLLRATHPHDAASRRLLLQMLARNGEILELATHARNGAGDAVRAHGQAHRALRAYVGAAT